MRRVKPTVGWAGGFGVLMLALSACHDEPYGVRGVADAAPPDAAPDAGVPDAAVDAPAPDAGQPVRRLLTRSPWGRVSVPQNLLLDGDFELSGAEGQFGWLSFSRGGAGLRHETGGLCRSGVSCGVLQRGQVMLGYAVAAPEAPMELRVWLHPASGGCDDVGVYVIGCVSERTPILGQARASQSAPDADGWCELSGVTPVVREQPCVYLDNESTGIVRVDDVTLLPLAGQAKLAQRPAPSVAVVKRATEAAAAARAGRQYGLPAALRGR